MTNLTRMRREIQELRQRKGASAIPDSFNTLVDFVNGDISFRNAVIKLMKEKPPFWELQKIIIESCMSLEPQKWDEENREYLKGIFRELEEEDKQR